MSDFQPASLKDVAFAIEKDWVKVSPSAQPYLDALKQLDSINDSYYADTAKSVVLYFLANASSYRGESAKAYKTYLKSLVK